MSLNRGRPSALRVRSAPPVLLSPSERAEVERLSTSPEVTPRLQMRAWIVLRASQGTRNREIAREFFVTPATVALWRYRFLVHRLPGILADAPRSGRRPRISATLVSRIAESASPAGGGAGGRRSSRATAAAHQVSQSTVVRIWKRHRRTSPGPVSDPTDLAAEVSLVRDVRGLYVAPSDRAVVLVSAVRGPEAGAGPSAPGIPPVEPDNPRRGGRDPLAAVRVLYRTSLPEQRPRDRVREFLLFLQGVRDGLQPGDRAHLLLRTDRLHKEAEVLRWLRRHPEFHLYATPASIEDAEPDFLLPTSLSVRGVRASGLRSLNHLVEAFRAYSQTHLDSPRPFVWAAVPPNPLGRAHRGARRPAPRPTRDRPAPAPPLLTATMDLDERVAPRSRLAPLLALPTFRAALSGAYGPGLVVELASARAEGERPAGGTTPPAGPEAPPPGAPAPEANPRPRGPSSDAPPGPV